MKPGAGRARQWALALRSSPEERQARREGLFFYLTVLLVLAGLSAFALVTSPALRSPARLALFSVLMLVHGLLHWRSPLVSLRPGWVVPYLVAQGALVVTLVAVGSSTGLALGLFPTLIGVTAGAVHDKRLGVTAALAYLALGLWTLSWRVGWTGLSHGAFVIATTGLFAVAFALAYRRQVDARDEVQSLLGALTLANERLAEHARRIEDLTRTTERQRMARDLHDTLAQGLAGLILLIEAAANHLRERHADRTGEILEHALVRARQTLAEARQAIDGLRDSPASDDAAVTIRGEAERFAAASGIACHLDVAALAEVADGARQEAQRIVAEALRNVARHARATTVKLVADQQGSQVELVVEDDGIGFDVDAEAAAPGHYGLLGMSERARLAGGTLRVETSPGHGTRVCLRLPTRSG